MDGFIEELSKHIGRDWKKLARNLGLSKTDIDAIDYDNNHNLEEQIYQFFCRWRQSKGGDATVELLVDGLKAAELNEQLKLMQKAGFLPEDEQSTQSSSKCLQQNPKQSVTCGECGQKGHTKRSKNCPYHDEKCECGELVTERTVKKGKNKGRVFYNCSKPVRAQCGYFRFQGDERPPLCKCGLVSFRRTAKEGKDKGKVFYICPKPKADQCGYFRFKYERRTVKTKPQSKGLRSGKTRKSRKRGNPWTSGPAALKKPKLGKKHQTIYIHAKSVNIN